MIQFITDMIDEKLISFDSSFSAWKWDLSRINSKSYTDNQADLTLKKIFKLSEASQEALKRLASLGSYADLETLKIVFHVNSDELFTIFRQAIDQKIIVSDSNNLKFLHDRLHEAAYSLIPEEEREREHLRIASLLMRKLDDNHLFDKSYEIVSHLFNAINLIELEDISFRKKAARLCLVSAQLSKRAAAFESWGFYSELGQNFLGIDGWNIEDEELFSLSWDLIISNIESEIAKGKYHSAQFQLDIAKGNTRNDEDRAVVISIQIDIYTLSGQYIEAITTALEYLKFFNLNISLIPNTKKIQAYEEATIRKIDITDNSKIMSMPLMEDEKILSAVDVICTMLPSAYFIDIRLHKHLVCSLLELTLKHGIAPQSAMAFAAYGFELTFVKKYVQAEAFGRIAEKLLKKYNFYSFTAKIYNLIGATIYLWKHDFNYSIGYLEDGIKAENNDIFFSCMNSMYKTNISFWAGQPLHKVYSFANETTNFTYTRKYEVLGEGAIGVQKFCQYMQGIGSLDDPEFENKLDQNPLKALNAWYALVKLQAAIIFEDVLKAKESLQKLESTIQSCNGQIPFLDYKFFESLYLLMDWEKLNSNEKKQRTLKIKNNLDDFKYWFEMNPRCFSSR